jgi:hypothetical protein
MNYKHKTLMWVIPLGKKFSRFVTIWVYESTLLTGNCLNANTDQVFPMKYSGVSRYR